MKEIADYVFVRRQDERDILKVTTGTEFEGGRRITHESLAYEDYTQAGVIRWASNDRCVPLDICRRMQWYNLEAQEAANNADTTALLAEYRKRQEAFEARTDPEAMEIKRERMFEWLANFGPGETVVDVVTGRIYRT